MARADYFAYVTDVTGEMISYSLYPEAWTATTLAAVAKGSYDLKGLCETITFARHNRARWGLNFYRPSGQIGTNWTEFWQD